MADDVITGLVKGNESLNRQFVNNLNTIDIRRVANERIPFAYQTEVITAQECDSSVFILSHHIQSMLVETSSEDGFWLTDGTTGFTDTRTRVLNKNNIFQERFIHTDFVDDSITTATITTSSGRIDFGGGEIFQSKIVALNNVAYTQAKLIPTGSYSGLTPYVSFNGGSTFNVATWNVPLVVSNTSTDGIIIKIIETTTTGLSFPIVMPVTFVADASSDYLTNLKIQYS